MLAVVRYIITKNKGLDKLKYLVLGVLFQLFKRLTGSVISKKLFNGKSIFLYPACNVSTQFAYTSIPDREEIFILRNLAQKNPGSVFLDIGANIGSYSICMMDLCVSIFAFEPHPFTAKRCKLNFILNGRRSDEVHESALSDVNGSIHFTDVGGSSTINHITSDQSGIQVLSQTLDSFAFDHSLPENATYLIKMDVEGFEKDVLKGAQNFLQTHIVLGIIFESFDTSEVFGLLKQAGFTQIRSLGNNNFFAEKTILKN